MIERISALKNEENLETPFVGFGEKVFVSRDIESLGIREATVKSFNKCDDQITIELKEEPGFFDLNRDVFKTRSEAEAVLVELIAALERQAIFLKKHLQKGENGSRFFTEPVIESSADSKIVVTRFPLTELGREALRVKSDFEMPKANKM